MKTTLYTAALLPALAMAAMAQAPAQTPFQTPALLISEDGSVQKAWLVSATKSQLTYRETAAATEFQKARLLDFKSIFLSEPREYTAAMDLYQARKYQEAKAQFIAVKERFKPVYAVENSHAALAAFYEMESLRKLGDLEGLAAALQQFDKSPLTRDTQMRQLELYVLWDAVRTKDWATLESLASERSKSRLSADLRAQVSYLHGLALEGLERPEEALLAYQTAMTADAGASEDIARMSALRILAILNGNEEVQRAIRAWGTKAENKNSAGYTKLMEAAAVAKLYELILGAGAPLPTEYQELLKYLPKEEPKQVVVETPEAKSEVKPEVKPEAKPEVKPEAKPQPKKPKPKKAPK